jgi:hypothetical protein
MGMTSLHSLHVVVEGLFIAQDLVFSIGSGILKCDKGKGSIFKSTMLIVAVLNE